MIARKKKVALKNKNIVKPVNSGRNRRSSRRTDVQQEMHKTHTENMHIDAF